MWLTHWRLRDRDENLHIEVGYGATSDREACERSRREVDALLWRGLNAGDSDVRHALEAIYYQLRGMPAPTASHRAHGSDFEHSLAGDLRFAASSGRLRVDRVEPKRLAMRPVAPPVEAYMFRPEPEPDAWIAIELVDQDGKPVANVEYRIVCDDGRVRTGTTNVDGKAREEGMHEGNCKVSFPGLNGPDWKKAS